MKVLLEFSSRLKGGGKTFLDNFVQNLAKIDSKNIYHLFVSSKLSYSLPPNFLVKVVSTKMPYELWKIFWYQTKLRKYMANEKIDLFYGPSGISPINTSCQTLLTLQNLWPFYSDQLPFYLKIRKSLLKWFIIRSVKSAALLHFPSLSAEHDHIKLGLHFDYKKARVIPFGVGDAYLVNHGSKKSHMILNELNLADKNYILFVGNIFRHKNLTTLVKAFARVLHQLNHEIYLVIAGKIIEPDYYSEMLALAHNLRIKSNLIFTGEIIQDALPPVYRNAKLFVFPSLLETFGFPMLEAMASKIPLLTSDIAISREICGDAACYFPTYDDATLASLMIKFLSDHEVRRSLIRKGWERAKRFSWQNMAQNMLNLFEETITIPPKL